MTDGTGKAAARQRWPRLVVVLAAILLFILAGGSLILSRTKDAATPDIRSEFLGFTNMSGGLAARFSLSNYPFEAIMPVVVEMAVQEHGVWVPITKPARGWPFLQLSIGGRPQVVYTLSVPTTNLPARVVVEIRTPPTGWRALAQRLAVRVGRNPRQWHVSLPALYFTNDTIVAHSTHGL